MSIAFLIDECLSPDLAGLAHTRGFVATALRDRAWTGLEDREVVERAFDNDLVLQAHLFAVALDELETNPDLVNQALEVVEEEDGAIAVVRYALP